ncbi:MAG: hypothetical protein H6706_07290 [Myxococcales bacterium]|nr:hypothetical protein [Myxococcales bacterium]
MRALCLLLVAALGAAGCDDAGGGGGADAGAMGGAGGGAGGAGGEPGADAGPDDVVMFKTAPPIILGVLGAESAADVATRMRTRLEELRTDPRYLEAERGIAELLENPDRLESVATSIRNRLSPDRPGRGYTRFRLHLAFETRGGEVASKCFTLLNFIAYSSEPAASLVAHEAEHARINQTLVPAILDRCCAQGAAAHPDDVRAGIQAGLDGVIDALDEAGDAYDEATQSGTEGDQAVEADAVIQALSASACGG